MTKLTAQELRIGNWILERDWSGKFIPTQVHSLHEFDSIAVNVTKDADGCWDYVSWKPIELSEEWLVKMGINKWFGNDRYEIRANYNQSFTIYAWGRGVSIFICHLKYVHEFQNAYPILTGTELTIKVG
jgi:hypothetical protein